MDITNGTARAASTFVADICLYGSTHAGWLVRMADGRMYGTGDPVAGQSMTDAVWAACDQIRARHFEITNRVNGLVRVFEPTGRRMATIEIGRALPWFGDLVWEPAPVYTISAEALIAAGTEAR